MKSLPESVHYFLYHVIKNTSGNQIPQDLLPSHTYADKTWLSEKPAAWTRISMTAAHMRVFIGNLIQTGSFALKPLSHPDSDWHSSTVSTFMSIYFKWLCVLSVSSGSGFLILCTHQRRMLQGLLWWHIET